MKSSGICFDCGATANALTCLKRYGAPPKKIAHSVSTYHKGTCIVCGEMKPVTEERDFFYPELDLIKKVVKLMRDLPEFLNTNP